jgi:ubiquitin carboxyl-terminal hydrolase 25/28
VIGKTAPRFIRDLLDYDPRRARQEGKNFNVFTDPAPIYRKNGKLLPLRMLPQDCQHRLFRKELQTVIPLVDQKPSTSSQYISSSYCAHCLYHFDVVIDYTRRPGRETPCELGTYFPLHHLQHCQTRKGTAGEKEKRFDKYEDYKEAHTFACSAPNCPALVDVRISPPRLSKEYLSLLWDPAKVSRRGQKAIQEQPDRYQNAHPLHPSEVMTVMRTYLCDALNKSPTDKKRIAIRNKKFLLAFSDECDAVFEYLDFERETETSADGVGSFQFECSFAY